MISGGGSVSLRFCINNTKGCEANKRRGKVLSKYQTENSVVPTLGLGARDCPQRPEQLPLRGIVPPVDQLEKMPL